MANTSKGARLKRALAQSTYITAAWNWFMILAGKAAEPVLVASVLYASVKLLPIVHFPPQFDVAVFIAQFVALDIGGLSLNKLADQAKQDGNDKGALHAKRLSIALVVIMLTGVIMAGVNQVVTLDSHVATVIDTILLIARAVMAVLYSRVIHSLRGVETEQPIQPDALEAMRTDMLNQLADTLSRQLEERITKQTETLTQMVETALATRPPAEREAHPIERPTKVRSITEAASRRRAASGNQSIDKIIWPLLDAGQSVRTIASQTTISAGRVGRSRKRWKAAQGVSVIGE
jgi:predicted transcriptional regulator